ncbi:B-lymphocyte antigen CD20-like isoform X2 [Hyaena hyaena]|uniref:B-lymphocyte antigen CD20-like isoform X2 n=1 Tax=Hyaena hyaena TaxID=95912 RepID=UPI001921F396|nr:B-lymphocyte antigen CD20-like isoform X2 [Hyaena hyaena]
MSEEYTLKLETRALGAVQIMNGMIYSALGSLCYALFVEEGNGRDTGYVPVIVTLTYIFLSPPFFVMSGSFSIQTQKHPTKYKLIFSLVMNIISACLSALGILILSIASLTYHPEANAYNWSHLTGGMLLQYVLFTTIAEVICACFIIKWIGVAIHHPECSEMSCTAPIDRR